MCKICDEMFDKQMKEEMKKQMPELKKLILNSQNNKKKSFYDENITKHMPFTINIY